MPKRIALIPVMVIVLQLVYAACSWGVDVSPHPNPQPAEVKADSNKPQSLEAITSGTEKAEGLWTMYHKDQRLLVDLPSRHLDKNFIILTSIARGIGSGGAIGGMSLGAGDGVVWSFHKNGDKIHVLRRNVRFRAKPGTPEADSVKVSYSDSVLYSLPIEIDTPNGHLVDMTRIFMSDDQQIGRFIGPGFAYAPDRSTLEKVKSFPKNVEVQVAAVYSGAQSLETVADSRGVQVSVHYSISMLPENGYAPRNADDRIGYFITAGKDFSAKEDDQNFVRYINRWNLKKKDPSAKLSPPEEPIVFYIEKTVPVHLRPYVQAGIEEWNKAFEKLGFSKAIVVLQQGDDDTWDPEDIRYNTFRWITGGSGFAMGATRVNPMTGQILDADIIFDAGFLDYWKQDYETFANKSAPVITAEAGAQYAIPFGDAEEEDHPPGSECMLWQGMQQQMAFAAAAMTATGLSQDCKLPDEFIYQALKHAVMHEVGHTLGLRHNFKASSWKSLTDIEAAACKLDEPMVSSVMDYCPANMPAIGLTQGLYFSQTIGPYDYWVVEYGYKPIKDEDQTELGAIASRGAREGLDYATDEDCRVIDPDPFSNPFDLGNDPVAYARRQISASAKLLPEIVDRTVNEGEGYQRARQAFGMLMGEYQRAAYFASRIPGGVYMRRIHKGQIDNTAPFKVIEATKQREAMELLFETVFASPSYDPSLLNSLAPTRWSHWGVRNTPRLDYPIHEVVSKLHTGVLSQLLNPLTLARIQDNELKVPQNEEAYTLAEHIDRVFCGVFAEIDEPRPGAYANREPYVSSFRRNLQRLTLKHLANMVVIGRTYPEDARMLTRMHLTELDGRIEAILKREDMKLDDYSKAHLLDSHLLIQQALGATLQVDSIS
jgi:predicted Zn-dependent protease with MMP-like domain